MTLLSPTAKQRVFERQLTSFKAVATGLVMLVQVPLYFQMTPVPTAKAVVDEVAATAQRFAVLPPGAAWVIQVAPLSLDCRMVPEPATAQITPPELEMSCKVRRLPVERATQGEPAAEVVVSPAPV